MSDRSPWKSWMPRGRDQVERPDGHRQPGELDDDIRFDPDEDPSTSRGREGRIRAEWARRSSRLDRAYAVRESAVLEVSDRTASIPPGPADAGRPNMTAGEVRPAAPALTPKGKLLSRGGLTRWRTASAGPPALRAPARRGAPGEYAGSRGPRWKIDPTTSPIRDLRRAGGAAETAAIQRLPEARAGRVAGTRLRARAIERSRRERMAAPDRERGGAPGRGRRPRTARISTAPTCPRVGLESAISTTKGATSSVSGRPLRTYGRVNRASGLPLPDGLSPRDRVRPSRDTGKVEWGRVTQRGRVSAFGAIGWLRLP